MNKKTNGVNTLSQDQENMRMQVVDLELKARYWKAQYEIRQFTLEAEKIQPEYDIYLADQKAKSDEMMKKFEEQLALVNQNAEEGAVVIDGN